MDGRLPKLVFPGLNLDSRAGHPGVVAAVRQALTDAGGRIPFARFMDLALHHTEHGYYRRSRPVGRRGDFLTSPEVHPVFAAALACQLHEIWLALGQPRPFRVVEAGGGSGRLARDIRTWMATAFPALAEATLYTLIDPAPSPPEEGAPELNRIRAKDLSSLAKPLTGVLLSNELLDAMPVYRLQYLDGRWQELWVRRVDDDFAEELGPVSDPRLLDWVEGFDAVEGQIVEVSPAATTWIESAARVLDAGVVLTLDYGDLQPRLWTEDRKAGTLRCFADHGLNHDPFRAVGKQDITASVNFSAIAAAGRDAGLSTAGFTTQTRFLWRWGVDEILRDLSAASFDSDDVVADRQAISWLTNPDGLGGVKVLAQAKNVEPFHLTGFDGPEVAGATRRLAPGRYPRIPVHDPFAPLR